MKNWLNLVINNLFENLNSLHRYPTITIPTIFNTLFLFQLREVFIFVISHIVPEIFTIFVLCKLGTDDVIRCDSMEVKTQNRDQYLICILQKFA